MLENKGVMKMTLTFGKLVEEARKNVPGISSVEAKQKIEENQTLT